MDKFLKFLTSPMGKFLIAVIVTIIVGYLAYIMYQKSIYNGMTKKQVEERVKTARATIDLAYIKENDTNYLNNTYPLLEILSWYDDNSKSILREAFVKSQLKELGIEVDKFNHFSNLYGTEVSLVSYS